MGGLIFPVDLLYFMWHMKYIAFSIIAALACMGTSFSAYALQFNPNTIISDSDFFRTDEMDAQDIQTFLETKGSSLASYRALDSDGIANRASDIIYQAAIVNGINPKVILVLLQKEQSLIENTNPSQYNYDWATGFARCDSCSVDDPAVAANKGFSTQVQKAAWRKAYYTTHWSEFNSQPQKSMLIDGMPVTPTNAATAALYNYTPHIRGNISFWKLWNRYFSRVFPDGTVVKTSGSNDMWLIQEGKRRPFSSLSAFLSRYSMHSVVFISQNDLETYPIGTPIKFPRYSLLKAPSGAVFLLGDDGKYGIPSKKIFRSIGYNPDEIISVTDQDIADIPTIGLITDASKTPRGELMQDRSTGGVYYVANGVRHPLLERAILQANFPGYRLKQADSKRLASLTLGDPMLFEDGTLVMAPDSHDVYVISNGQRRAIVSETVFTSLGYQWSNIIRSNGRTLQLHPEGGSIDLGAETPEVSLPLATAHSSF